MRTWRAQVLRWTSSQIRCQITCATSFDWDAPCLLPEQTLLKLTFDLPNHWDYLPHRAGKTPRTYQSDDPMIIDQDVIWIFGGLGRPAEKYRGLLTVPLHPWSKNCSCTSTIDTLLLSSNQRQPQQQMTSTRDKSRDILPVYQDKLTKIEALPWYPCTQEATLINSVQKQLLQSEHHQSEATLTLLNQRRPQQQMAPSCDNTVTDMMNC